MPDSLSSTPAAVSSRQWKGLTQREIWRQPMEHTPKLIDRFLGRVFLSLFHSWLIDVRGFEHIARERDPFILALNHNQRLESLLIPILLIHHRHGKLIHFLGDWNFFLIPIIGSYYRRSGSIIVTRKQARPRILNRLKPLFEQPLPAMTRALHKLQEGACVGIFPEGTINRDPRKMLRGSPSAARLSIESGAPIVPVGVRFPGHDPAEPIGDLEKMAVEIGAPMNPPVTTGGERASAADVREWHAELMQTLARLSGKSWPP